MMSSQISIETLPLWARLNDVDISNIDIKDVPGKGSGIVASRSSQSSDTETQGSQHFLTVPRDLILSAEAVEDYAKVDRNFRQLLDKTGRQSSRGDILIYLLVHLIPSSRGQLDGCSIASTAWTEYIKFLSHQIPVPSQWSDQERSLLQGTSLEAAVRAKLTALTNEFEEFREKSSELPFWNSYLWENEAASILDWNLVDAWYRSRCLELPFSGNSMVPSLDMVNHSHTANSYYEQDADGNVLLLPRQGIIISDGDELTISYGQTKSAAEMLFSYGFVDPDSEKEAMTLLVEPFTDDPLAQAKFHIFREKPTMKLYREAGVVEWSCPFVHLMVLNEEDGLEFRVLQDTMGERQLQLFWQDQDVSGRVREFESLTQDHPLHAVFQLRAIAVLDTLVTEHLEKIQNPMSSDSDSSQLDSIREECRVASELLRSVETHLLEDTSRLMEHQKSVLLSNDQVRGYLGLDIGTDEDHLVPSSTDEEPDFS